MNVGNPLRSVCLAIASYRNDDEVLTMLRRVCDRPHPFAHVFVVDSEGTGVIEKAIADAGWEGVTYLSESENVGAAGNLLRRLQCAAGTDANFVYAVNHDGQVELDVVERLLHVALARPNVGAVYPLRRRVNRGGAFDQVGVHRLPVWRGAPPPESSDPIPVLWSSSNGALYSLRPVRRGVLPWPELFMGWEDLAYGWLLEHRGYEQLVVPDVVFDDPYEYRRARLGPWSVMIADKEPWRTYYSARNLLLIARKLGWRRQELSAALAKIGVEAAVTTLLRSEKLERWRMLLLGSAHGFLGRGGKWVVP